MACVNIDNRIVSRIKRDSIIAELNMMIDNELAKDANKVNIKLVNECVDAILTIEQDNDDKLSLLIPLLSSEEFLNKIKPHNSNWKNLNVFLRAGIVAAVIASSTITANAAVNMFTGVNVLQNIGNAVLEKFEDWGLTGSNDESIINTNEIPEETTTKPPEENAAEQLIIAEQTTAPEQSAPKQTLSGEQTAAAESPTEESTAAYNQQIQEDAAENKAPEETTTQQSTTKVPNKPLPDASSEAVTDPVFPDEEVFLTGISAQFHNFKTDYIYGEELTYDGMTLYAVYSDKSKTEISLSDCDYTKRVNMNETADYTLRIIYNSCILEINITVRPDEYTRGSEICSNDLYDYLLTNEGAYITAYYGNEKSIVLDEIDGNKVIAIGPNVFAGSDIEYVYAQNLMKIFPSAFENCTALIDCYTPRADSIGSSAFSGCTSLEEAVFSTNLTYIGKAAYKKTAITNITIPGYITEIPARLCMECPYLKEVTFSENVTVIGESAFSDCPELTSVYGTKNIIEVEEFAFYNDTAVDFDVFPKGLEIAKEYAFAFCNSLNIGALGSGIHEIGEMAFAYCYKLTEITIPSDFTEIPYGAFRGTRITSVKLPDGLKVIGDYAFMSTQIERIDLPENVEKIGTFALYTTSLREVYFNRNIREIDDNAFFAGSKLKFFVYDNTAALEYAIENNIEYEIIGTASGAQVMTIKRRENFL